MSGRIPPSITLTRRQTLKAAGAMAALGAIGLPRRAAAAAQELNILVWCDHTDATLLQPFEQAHNCRINVKDYQETGAALAILEQSQPGDWDVFVVDSVDVRRVVERKLLAPLDGVGLPWDDIFPDLHAPELHKIDGKTYAIPEKFRSEERRVGKECRL